MTDKGVHGAQLLANVGISPKGRLTTCAAYPTKSANFRRQPQNKIDRQFFNKISNQPSAIIAAFSRVAMIKISKYASSKRVILVSLFPMKPFHVRAAVVLLCTL